MHHFIILFTSDSECWSFVQQTTLTAVLTHREDQKLSHHHACLPQKEVVCLHIICTVAFWFVSTRRKLCNCQFIQLKLVFRCKQVTMDKCWSSDNHVLQWAIVIHAGACFIRTDCPPQQTTDLLQVPALESDAISARYATNLLYTHQFSQMERHWSGPNTHNSANSAL